MQPILPLGVRVPGSSANLGPGFDTFGVALQIYLEARISPADPTVGPRRPLVRCIGPNSEGIALDSSNLVLTAFRRAFERAGREAPGVCLELRNEIPLERGLGSSGAAIVAGLELADRCGQLRLAKEAKLALAAELEQGHPDNVSASLLGGFTIACTTQTGSGKREAGSKKRGGSSLLPPRSCSVRALSLPWPEEIELVAAIPGIRLATQKARAALPARYARQDVVFNLQRAALLAAALGARGTRDEGRRARGEGRGTRGEGGPETRDEIEDLVSLALADRLHQPYRAPLVPGLTEALELCLPGLLGVALSGAGPSLLAFVSGNRANVVAALERIYAKLGIPCEVRAIAVSVQGARELRD